MGDTRRGRRDEGKLVGLVRFAQFVLLAIVVVAVWPVVGPVWRGEVEWADAVDAVVSDQVVLALVAAVGCGVALVLLRSDVARSLLMLGALAVLVALVSGTVTVGDLRDRLGSDARDRLVARAAQCGYSVEVEDVGERVRVALRDPQGARQTFYSAGERLTDDFGALLGEEGQEVPGCLR